MSNDSSFYLKRKQKLNELKRKEGDNSSPIYKRMLDILSSEAEEGFRDSIESPFESFQEKITNDDSTFEERFEKYIKEVKENG